MKVDLRLAPTALGAWATAWALTGIARADPGAALRTVVVAASLVAALALGLTAATELVRARRAEPGARAHRLVPGARVRRVAPSSGALGPCRARTASAHLLLILAAVTAVALSVHVRAAGAATLEALAADRCDVVLTGRVVADGSPAAFGRGQTWALAADTLTARAVTSAARGRVAVTTSQDAPPYGARVVVRARLAPAPVGAAEAARATAQVAEVTRSPPAVVRATNAMRAGLLDVTEGLSAQARGLVPGMAVGDTSRLPTDLADAFRTTGLTHLTAVSGGHFAIVLTLVTACAGAARAPRSVRIAVVALVGAGFVLLVRPEPSVQRAAAMCAVTLIGLVLRRPASSVPALAACVAVLLCADPWLARSFGFALSCAATAGLVLLAPPLLRRLEPWLGRAFAFALAVPIAAQVACGPVLVLLSPALPTTSALANLLAAPAVAPATLLGLAATLAAPWWAWGAHALAWLASGATWWIAGVAQWCAALPGALLPWPGGVPGALGLLAASAAVLAPVLARAPAEGWPRSWSDGVVRARRGAHRRGRATLARLRHGALTRGDRRLLAALATVALVVAGATTAVVRVGVGGGGLPAGWQVVACDVGQGDALVVRTGPTAAIVVDVGPEGDAAGRCLDRLGVTRVDLLALTHHHLDHVGGLAGVLAGREVGAAWVSPLDEPAANARHSQRLLDRAGVPRRVPDQGEAQTWGEGEWRVEVSVLSAGVGAGGPPAAVAGESAEGDGANDASLVLGLTAQGPGGSLEVIALGDLEEHGQQTLLTSLRAAGSIGPADGVDVVKVAHHGSASQSAGLARLLRPRVALVSVGADNAYGHPTDRMLDLYASVGARAVRTDRCGTAALVVRGGEIGLACG
ncbi:ComEC/Rec2 family competence protein [Xylanimonas ulmi]|uniref:Competence protein ComEC n=1 Tax=Xylanimonas ulmi TaxID=228973 RepID=A0A4Q7LZL3_9MICO|nr:ComEC/Rec2 family competence protein [Xylanibacterium ulmi]RZS60251.1 competence protein ComEC [Xylanibacterium ulmi]